VGGSQGYQDAQQVVKSDVREKKKKKYKQLIESMRGENKMAKSISGLLSMVACMLVMVSDARAAIDLPESLSITSWESVMSIVIVGLAALWAGRKVIKTLNRS